MNNEFNCMNVNAYSMLPCLKPTVLLSLPNELFLNYIFTYLDSIDLLRAFGRLYNCRLNALLYEHIRHIDFSTISIDEYPSLKTNKILSIRINVDRAFSYTLPVLNHLDLRLTTIPENLPQMFVLTQLKVLTITFISDKLEIESMEQLTPFIWHTDSCLRSLSTLNCNILNNDDLLTINRHLTRLSLDFGHIRFAILLMPFVPALEYFEVRLHAPSGKFSSVKSEFIEGREWPTKVRSLRFTAHDQLLDTLSFCGFVKRFSQSLKYLSFYISTPRGSLMSGSGSLERYLLKDLLHLQQIDFCVNSGVIDGDFDRRLLFDRWTRREVISIHNSARFLTRFTIPFIYDRLEYVSNDFLDYHCNFRQSNIKICFPNVVSATFSPRSILKLALFKFLQETCPNLHHIRFRIFCRLDDDLIQNTDLTLSTVTKLSLNDLKYPIQYSTLYALLFLTPNLEHLIIKRDHMTIDETNNDHAHDNIFAHIKKVTIIDE